MWWALAWWAACGGPPEPPSYDVVGVVVETRPPDRVVVDHEAIDGFMDAMVMPFALEEPAWVDGLVAGQRIEGRYVLHPSGAKLTDVRVVGRTQSGQAFGVLPVAHGQAFPATDIPTVMGERLRVGSGQKGRVALTFVFTRCPLPEVCPALLARLMAIREALPVDADVTLLAVTLDPVHDTPDVLARYAAEIGADKRIAWGRLEGDALAPLAAAAGLAIVRDGDAIAHGLRTIVLDNDGTLIERYDDAAYPLERIVQQLTAGTPRPTTDDPLGTLSTQ